MISPTLHGSSLFTPWKDPVSGVTSYILSKRIAPIQQSFYFTNPSLTDDGRFLWFYAAFPPGGDAYYGRQLAVVDFAEQSVSHFPETQFMDASPYVDKETGEAYWNTGLEIWKRSPLPSGEATRIASFPTELARNRRPLRIATHLTRSVDKKSFAIDAQIGSEWFVGDLPVDGVSPFQLWQKFSICHNHTQFSPTDPDVLLTAQDGWVDPITGETGKTLDRLWLLRRGESARPLCPDAPLSSDWRGHEWWDADGLHVWYIDYKKGTEKVHIHTGERTNVWSHGHTHSHNDRESRYLVGDIMEIPEHFEVTFFNIETKREVTIASHLPPLSYRRSSYHIHPHPQFCFNDQYICYTTNVLGNVDVALVPVTELIRRTS